MKYHLIAFYLEYVNDFLTVAVYAEFQGMTIKETENLLDLGKKYQQENAFNSLNTGWNNFAEFVKRNNLKHYERFI